MSVSNFSHSGHFHQNHIHDGRRRAMLKVFDCYLLPNRKWDGAEIRWKAFGQHGDSELLKGSVLISKIATMAAILKIFKPHLLPNGNSD